jgi:probable rRNA maturation factor
MAAIEVLVSVDDDLSVPIESTHVEAAVRAVFEAENVGQGEMSFAFVDDREISRVNEAYLQHEGPADVISFPLHLDGDSPVGDVYIGVEQARRQAEELGIPLAEELLRLTVHGTLHVLGYDHPEGDDRFDSPMFRRQEALLRSILDSASS